MFRLTQRVHGRSYARISLTVPTKHEEDGDEYTHEITGHVLVGMWSASSNNCRTRIKVPCVKCWCTGYGLPNVCSRCMLHWSVKSQQGCGDGWRCTAFKAYHD